jgi:hypothetical protein
MNSPDYYAELESLGMVKCVPCSEADQVRFRTMNDSELPENVFYDGSGDKKRFMCYIGAGVSTDQLNTLILVKAAQHIKTIKSCVVFFTVLAVISLFVTLLSLFLR